MADVSPLGFDAINGDAEKKDGEQPGGDRNGEREDEDAASGKEENGSVDDSADSSGSAQCPIHVVAVDGEGQEVSAHDAGYIDDEQSRDPIVALNIAAEGVEGEHVECKVDPVGMEEAGCDHPVVFPAFEDGLRFKQVAVEETCIAKALISENRGADDDEVGKDGGCWVHLLRRAFGEYKYSQAQWRLRSCS